MIIAFAACAGGCGDTHEGLAEKSVAKAEELAGVAKGIGDEASGRAAVAKIQAIEADMKQLRDRKAKLNNPNATVEANLKQKYEARVAKAWADLARERARLATVSPDAAKALDAAMAAR
jgi:hypothetical protein